MLSKHVKHYFAIAFIAAAVICFSANAPQALAAAQLDKGLEAEIREELALSANESITEDEIAILTSLFIEDAKKVKSLNGLEAASFLTYVHIEGSNKELDISALTELTNLEELAINVHVLNETGNATLTELRDMGVAITEVSDVKSGNAPIQVFIDGEYVEFTADPVLINNTTMVQFRPLFEQFGLEVGWEQQPRTVTGVKEKLQIELVINNKTATVSGQSVELPVAPALLKDNTMVPLRFIGEATGRRVLWDGENRIIHINSSITSYNFQFLYSNDIIYSGTKLDGLPHGKGKLTFKGKLFYEGDFNKGVIEGTGKMFDLEDPSSYYEGAFKNNRFHGTGKVIYSDGAYYTGPFANGMREGSGKLFHPDGSLIYDGMFSLDAFHGKGTYTFGESKYIGDFQYGYYHGQGKFYYNGKLSYDGEWIDDNRYLGKWYDGKTLIYDGYFFNNKPDGYGTFYNDNGTLSYRGQVKSYSQQGIGIIYMDKGARYIGEVYDGSADGYGYWVDADQTYTNVGFWVDGDYYGEDVPPVTEASMIKLLLRNAEYGYVDGFFENDYGLDKNEAMMFIHLASEEHVDLFNSLSKHAKAALMNQFVQDHWGDVLGVDHCYTYVMHDGSIYAETTLSYEMADSDVKVKEYPEGNMTLE